VNEDQCSVKPGEVSEDDGGLRDGSDGRQRVV